MERIQRLSMQEKLDASTIEEWQAVNDTLFHCPNLREIVGPLYEYMRQSSNGLLLYKLATILSNQYYSSLDRVFQILWEKVDTVSNSDSFLDIIEWFLEKDDSTFRTFQCMQKTLDYAGRTQDIAILERSFSLLFSKGSSINDEGHNAQLLALFETHIDRISTKHLGEMAGFVFGHENFSPFCSLELRQKMLDRMFDFLQEATDSLSQASSLPPPSPSLPTPGVVRRVEKDKFSYAYHIASMMLEQNASEEQQKASLDMLFKHLPLIKDREALERIVELFWYYDQDYERFVPLVEIVIGHLLSYDWKDAKDFADFLEPFLEEYDDLRNRVLEIKAEKLQRLENMRKVLNDEAITEEKLETILWFNDVMERRPDIQRLLPSLKELSTSYEDYTKRIRNDLEADLNENKGDFQLNTAMLGLRILEGYDQDEQGRPIPTYKDEIPVLYQYYGYSNMPNLKQLFVLLYKILQEKYKKNIENFSMAWLHENWTDLQRMCKTDFFAYETAGMAIAANRDILSEFASLLTGTGSSMPKGFAGKASGKLMQAFWASPLRKFDMTPFREILFMMMRGHNANLFKPEFEYGRHKPACAEGVYLAILGAIAFELDIIEDAARLMRIELLDCSRAS